jgi:hypothetical protein
MLYIIFSFVFNKRWRNRRGNQEWTIQRNWQHWVHKTKTNKTKNATQYVLYTTIHKTQDEDQKNKKHNTICVEHHHTQNTRRRQTKEKHITICVGHHYM